MLTAVIKEMYRPLSRTNVLLVPHLKFPRIHSMNDRVSPQFQHTMLQIENVKEKVKHYTACTRIPGVYMSCRNGFVT